jgi:hypothetical protein
MDAHIEWQRRSAYALRCGKITPAPQAIVLRYFPQDMPGRLATDALTFGAAAATLSARENIALDFVKKYGFLDDVTATETDAEIVADRLADIRGRYEAGQSFAPHIQASLEGIIIQSLESLTPRRCPQCGAYFIAAADAGETCGEDCRFQYEINKTVEYIKKNYPAPVLLNA